MKTPKQITEEVVGILKGRKGFDDWWHDIEEDDQQEILAEISKTVAQAPPTYAIVYLDDGPSGICGQSMDTTSPHTRVFLFHSEGEALAWARIKFSVLPKRKRSRVVLVLPPDDPGRCSWSSVEWPDVF
jgi:hypothetical protein